ncbi:MAG: response regulator [Planctomycetota bacterium]
MTERKKVILIVDDEEDLAQSLSVYLEYDGFSVSVATDQQRAEELLNQNTYDAAVLDLSLRGRKEGEEGLDLAREIRARMPDTRLILITAQEEIGCPPRTFPNGIKILMKKPVSARTLSETLQNLWREE